MISIKMVDNNCKDSSSSNYSFFNFNNVKIFMPQEPNLFNKDGNFNHNLIFKLFPLSNADNEDEQHSILFQDEDAPKDSFQLLDDNDIADAKYNATEMVPEENSDDHMQINEEAIPKIFDITKVESFFLFILFSFFFFLPLPFSPSLLFSVYFSLIFCIFISIIKCSPYIGIFITSNIPAMILLCSIIFIYI